MKYFKYGFFFIFILLLCCTSVMAFNTETIDLSDEINVLYYDSDSIKIKINDEIVDKNLSIYYQFINSSEEEILSFENANDKADEDFITCLEQNEQNKCISNYNIQKNNISLTIPNPSNNWNKIKGNGSSIYSIPKFNNNYFLWVKALDENGREIYSLFYETAELDDSISLSGVKTTVGMMSNINDIIAVASIMLSLCGLFCFVFSIIYIIKYSNFRLKLN